MTDDGVRSLIERVRNAINRHDLDGFLDCFHEAYESEQPLDPERSSGVVTAFAEARRRPGAQVSSLAITGNMTF